MHFLPLQKQWLGGLWWERTRPQEAPGGHWNQARRSEEQIWWLGEDMASSEQLLRTCHNVKPIRAIQELGWRTDVKEALHIVLMSSSLLSWDIRQYLQAVIIIIVCIGRLLGATPNKQQWKILCYPCGSCPLLCAAEARKEEEGIHRASRLQART